MLSPSCTISHGGKQLFQCVFLGIGCCLFLCMIVAVDSAPTPTTNMVPVTIESSLKKGVVCPGDHGVTITCTTFGRELVWNISGASQFTYSVNTIVGDGDDQATYSVRLLQKRRVTDQESIFVSALLIRANFTEDPVRVECHNGRDSTEKSYEYHHVLGNFRA